MTAVCEPFPDIGDTAEEGVRPGDGFLAGHSRRAASLVIQDRTAEGSMVGPRTDTRVDTAERPEHDGHEADGVETVTGGGSVAGQLAVVEPIVRRVCRSRLGPADGDDAAQQTLVKLWRRLEAGPSIESLPTYAAVYARYEALASLRRFVDRPTVAVGEVAERSFVDGAPGPEAQTLRAADVAEAAARVEELLGQLTPAQARVLRTTKLAATEPDTEAAARELGITASSVRTAQARAMARLRELCGARSPNPLASGVSESARRQTAWAERPASRVAERMAHPSPAQTEFAGEFLRRRLDGGLSQSQLGAALGYDGSYVSKVERGKMWPSREFSRRVDEVLTTGEAFQDRHVRHRTDTGSGAVVEPRDQAAGHAALEDAAVAEHVSDDSPAAAACAAAHAAVQAAVEHAQTDEAGAGHATNDQAGDHDEQARAAQLARWHTDDQDTAATDSTADTAADTADEWAWLA